MSEPKSVDALLNQVEDEKPVVAPKPVEEIKAPEPESEPEDNTQDDDYNDEAEPQSEPEKAQESQDADEYGNPVAKPKLYTEEEVNRMMRERFSRSRIPQDQQQMQMQQAQQAHKDGFTFDENSNDSWEVQLEKFVERTVTNISKKQQEAEWQQREAMKQQEFEDKFTTGMSKYQDFRDVVGSKPITNAMLMAIRNIENPAAFIYAASKQHPQEIERIAKLDHYDQMVEMGRLEERMKKARTATKAAKPVISPKGDTPNDRDNSRLSIDDKIRQAERREMKRRQRG
jgi:hypothetical protein